MSKEVLAALAGAFAAAASELSKAAGGAPAAEAAPAASGKKGKASSGPTMEQLKEKLADVIKGKGRDTAIAILKKHGAAKLSDLDTAKYAEAFADAEAALKEDDSDDI